MEPGFVTDAERRQNPINNRPISVTIISTRERENIGGNGVRKVPSIIGYVLSNNTKHEIQQIYYFQNSLAIM